MKNRRHIIVHQQDQIEVYAGDTGYIVIKQNSPMDGDSVVFISSVHADAICQAISEAKVQAEKFHAEWIEEGDDESS